MKLYANCHDGFELHTREVKVSGRSMLDIGGNEGGYADSMLQKPIRRVVIVEPNPVLAMDMRTKYAPEPRAVVRQEGISDQPGELLGVRYHNTWTLAKPGEFNSLIGVGNIALEAEKRVGSALFDVKLTTLDAVVREEELDDLAFVKIDVDGYEARVLRGAEHMLSTLRPPMMLELSYLVRDIGDDVREFIRHIYRCDYVLTSMAGEVATEDEVMEQFPWHTSFDVMMVPKEILC